MVRRTMHQEYGEPNDEYGKHPICPDCGLCSVCGDCLKYGCGKPNTQQIKKDKDDGSNVSLSGDPKLVQRQTNKDEHMSVQVDNQSVEIKLPITEEQKWIDNWNELNRQFGELTKDNNELQEAYDIAMQEINKLRKLLGYNLPKTKEKS